MGGQDNSLMKNVSNSVLAASQSSTIGGTAHQVFLGGLDQNSFALDAQNVAQLGGQSTASHVKNALIV